MRRRFLDQSKHYIERTCNISMILCLTKTNDSIRLDYMLYITYDIPTHFLDDGKDRLIPLNRTIARIHDLRVQESGILPASLGEHWGVLKASRVLATNPVGDGKSSCDQLSLFQTSSDLQLPGSEDDCASDWWIVLETFRHWLDGLLGISVHAGGAIPSPKSLRRLAFGSSGSHFGQVLGKKTFSKLKLGFIDIELK